MVFFGYKAPKYAHGNRCGHMSDFPRLYERPDRQKKTYSVIHDALDALPLFYKSPKDYLAKIRHQRFKTKDDEAIAMNQQRSESREAVGLVTGYIINHLDLASMRLIRYKNGKPQNPSILDIASDLHIGYRRAQRALATLHKSGYISLEYQSFYINNKFIPRTAIKRVNQSLFIDLGVTCLRINEARHFAQKSPESKRRIRGHSRSRNYSPMRTFGEIISENASGGKGAKQDCMETVRKLLGRGPP